MRQNRWIFFVMPVFLMLFVLAAGYYLFSGIRGVIYPPPVLDGSQSVPDKVQPASPARQADYRVRFPGCGHLETWPGGDLPAELSELDFTALSREELAEALPASWQVAAYSDTQVILETEAKLCSICRQSRYLGVYRGKIAIYRGLPPNGVLERVTDFPVRDDVADQLEQGIPFKTTENLLWLLESYTS